MVEACALAAETAEDASTASRARLATAREAAARRRRARGAIACATETLETPRHPVDVLEVPHRGGRETRSA